MSQTPDLTDPWWQVVIAQRALRGATYKAEENQGQEFSDSEADSEEVQDGDEEEDEAEEELPDVTDDSFYYLDAETFDWQKELEAGLKGNTIVPSENSIELYNEQQQYFDNLKYQREDHENACAKLGIPNPDLPRLPEMRPSIVLKFWQPVAANAIMEFEKFDHLRGCILADVVGLGKTWITITYILAVSSNPLCLGRLPGTAFPTNNISSIDSVLTVCSEHALGQTPPRRPGAAPSRRSSLFPRPLYTNGPMK